MKDFISNHIQLALFEYCYISQRPKFGGKGTQTYVCLNRACPHKRFAPSASTEAMSRKKKRELELRLHLKEPRSEKIETNIKSAHNTTQHSGRSVITKHTNNATNVSNEGASSLSKSRKSPSIASTTRPSNSASTSGHGNNYNEVIVSNIHIVNDKRGCNNPASDGEELDAYSQSTHPLIDIDNVGGAAPDNLFLCQQELKCARTEINRQSEEIKRLKTAIQALTT